MMSLAGVRPSTLQLTAPRQRRTRSPKTPSQPQVASLSKLIGRPVLPLPLFMCLFPTLVIRVQNRESTRSLRTSVVIVTELYERQIIKGEENGRT